jgi:hypothetical protein
MSFGFPNVDQSLEPIRRAVLEAHAADVLFFAATGNKGQGWPIAFPACLDEVVSVGSTDGNNKISDFTPPLGVGKRLCAIGEAIEAPWKGEEEGPHATLERHAGTSYATPVAAGVAAMIMDFVWAERHRFKYEAQTLRTKRGMLAVLGNMVMPNSACEPLTPWKMFNETVNQPNNLASDVTPDQLEELLKVMLTPNDSEGGARVSNETLVHELIKQVKDIGSTGPAANSGVFVLIIAILRNVYYNVT